MAEAEERARRAREEAEEMAESEKALVPSPSASFAPRSPPSRQRESWIPLRRRSWSPSAFVVARRRTEKPSAPLLASGTLVLLPATPFAESEKALVPSPSATLAPPQSPSMWQGVCAGDVPARTP